ncbi:MAG: hypothetical protein WAL80_16395 [Xanthobacteraceae bacterium]|jgi:hypothetical protein
MLLVATLLSAIIVAFLLTVPTLTQVEEPWNIVVASEVVGFARITFIVALAHAVILGLPLFFILRSKFPIGSVSCALGGFIVGSAPTAVLALISMIGLQSASTGGKATVINGLPTLAGWIEYAVTVGSMGLFGLAGGLTFWLVLRASGQVATEPNTKALQPGKSRPAAWTIASVTIFLTCALLLLPNIVRDNSCHNLFRDGRSSIGPQILADMKLTAEDWPMLTQIFMDFGAAHSLSFRSDQQIRRGDLMWRDLNLCSDGVNIDAVDRPWMDRLKNSPLAGRGIQFAVYELKPGSDWNALARDLLDKLATTWPGKVTFRGRVGETLSETEALKGRQ